MSGFIFSGILHSYLSVPHRPVFPEPALGFTYLFKPKYGIVYGTYFEYLAVTYGVWVMWGFAAVCGLIGSALGIRQKSPTYRWQMLVSAAISMVLYYADLAAIHLPCAIMNSKAQSRILKHVLPAEAGIIHRVVAFRHWSKRLLR